MEKIRNYVKNGKGLGFLFLLASVVVMTIFMMFILKQTYSEMRPQIMLAVDEILPITVSGGKIVAPQDVYKRVDIRFGNDDNADILPVVLDTKSENSELPRAKAGLFIMKDVIYWINDDEVKRFILERDGEITKVQMEEKLNMVLGLFSLVIAVVLIIVLFGFSLIETVIIAVLGNLFLKINKADKSFSFDELMRLSAVAVSSVVVVCFILSLFGVPAMLECQFIVALLCVGLFLYKELQV